MMDMLSIVRSGRYVLAAMLLLQFVGMAIAAPSEPTQISSTLHDVCVTAKNILFVGAMLLVVLGAAVYAVGQILGAETRARASVWATAMFTGAIIGIVIYIVVPWVLAGLAGEAADTFAC